MNKIFVNLKPSSSSSTSSCYQNSKFIFHKFNLFSAGKSFTTTTFLNAKRYTFYSSHYGPCYRNIFYYGTVQRTTTNTIPFLVNSRTFSSLKVKESDKSLLREKESNLRTDISPSLKLNAAVIELDEAHFKGLSKEFADSLSKNQLKNIENVWKDVQPLTISKAMSSYSKLSKIRLTALVALTTLGGFYMGMPDTMNYTLLASTLIGTGLTSGSAAAWNHYLEVPFDSQMKRTADRPLVCGVMSPLHAASFAFVSGAAGLTILATCVNPLTAILGGLNLCLYSFIYTPMKRVHISNTWIGAIVGAIPPVMGFTAINNAIDLPSILLGIVLYSWQFPHFNALSWNMRHEYARAGYRMMSVTNPKLCLNTSLRHSVVLLGCTWAMCATDMTHWSFGVDSLPFSLYLIYLAYRFRAEPTSKTSRKLFLYSLIYLPVIMILMVISKNRRHTQSTTQSNQSKLSQPQPPPPTSAILSQLSALHR